MDDNLEQFRNWCLQAFAFLCQQYRFVEVEAADLNAYCVRFSNGKIQLAVKGEGYGTVAYICYVNRDGIEVPAKFLEPNWGPTTHRKKSKKKGPHLTQEQQIYSEAARIQERDDDILKGDYRRLDGVAVRWKNFKEKLFGHGG
jgi:hypothetical protein